MGCSGMVSSSTIKFFSSLIKLLAFYLLLLVPPELAMSAREPTKLVNSQQDVHKTSKHLDQMRIHGFLMWASMGFLMPVGVLIIRMSNQVHNLDQKSLKMLFYSHVILQTVAVFLAIAAAVLAVRNFDNAHQRLGLALYALMLLQSLIGFCRPNRGDRGRSIWYIVHLFIGAGFCAMAIVTVYLGLSAYRVKTRESTTRMWTTILFTAEVCTVGFIYLLQDRWDYMLKKQGVTNPSHEQHGSHLATTS